LHGQVGGSRARNEGRVDGVARRPPTAFRFSDQRTTVVNRCRLGLKKARRPITWRRMHNSLLKTECWPPGFGPRKICTFDREFLCRRGAEAGSRPLLAS
jgi:hypothetical protein